MHQPRPYGYFGPTDLAAEDAAFAETLMRRVTNIKQAGGLDSLRLTRALPGGGTVTALDMGGVQKVFVIRPTHEAQDFEADESIPLDVPMLFCGTVEKSILRHGEKASIRITKQTRMRLQGYAQQQIPGAQQQYDTSERQQLDRFTIPYAARFDEFVPKDLHSVRHTQYAQLRPTWYSGAMAQVVQLVGGYGKSKFDTKPANKTETAMLLIPGAVRQKIAAQLKGYRLFCSTGRPPEDGQIKYDYKYYECHAVAFGSDKKPWLVQVNRSGVYAMPLPMIPATTTKAFREWIEEVGDDEIKWALDRFGGLPSGEPFPTREKTVKAWERAGVVIKLCSTSDYYDHLAYSSAMGWSFNLKGTEAYNTCYDYDEGEGVAYGLMYCLSLSIGELADAKPKDDLSDADKAYMPQVAKYAAEVARRSRSDAEEGPAVRYKLRQASLSELISRVKASTDLEAEYTHWVNVQVEPIATGSGNVAEVGRGWLHNKAKFDFQPQIKFPEPLLGYCVSHDFRPLESGNAKDPKCDTPIFAYYVGDDLKVVKYSKDTKRAKPNVEDDFHDCMTVGSWTRTEHTEGSVHGHFYTTDIDDRMTMGDSVTTTKIVGKDLGFSSVPGFAFDDIFARPGTIYRKRYYTHNTTRNTEVSKAREIGLCVPYLCRGALLHARRDTTLNTYGTDSLILHSVQDPTSYRYWTHDNIHAWAGGLPKMSGKPEPKDGSPVWVEIEQYSPGACSDFADNGSWIKGLPTDYTWLIHPNKGEWRQERGDEGPKVNEYVNSYETKNKDERRLDVSIMDAQSHVSSSDVDSHYFAASPSSTGATFIRSAAKNMSGESIFGIVTEPFGSTTHWGYTRLFDGKSLPAFIGVINE